MFHHLKCPSFISLYARNLVNASTPYLAIGWKTFSTIFCSYKLLVKINVYVVVNESYLDCYSCLKTTAYLQSQPRLLVSC